MFMINFCGFFVVIDICSFSLSLSLSHSLMQTCNTFTAGCYFCGTRTEVAEHKKVCSFKDETQLLAIAMKEVTSSHTSFQCSRMYMCIFLSYVVLPIVSYLGHFLANIHITLSTLCYNVFMQMKEVKLTNEELKQSLAKSLKSIEKLSVERATMTKQLEQQAL